MLVRSDQTSGHRSNRPPSRWRSALWVAVSLGLCAAATAKTKPQPASAVSAAIEIQATLADATKAVEEVASDSVVYGTYVYEHDKTLTGAHQVDTSSAFGKSLGGKVFYKVAEDVIAPRHFKDAEDSGTITVRYELREKTPSSVSLRVDAVFVESARRVSHVSQGAVESAEFGQIQQHLDRIQAREKEAREDAEADAKAEARPETGPVAAAASPGAPPAARPEPLASQPPAALPEPAPAAVSQTAASQTALSQTIGPVGSVAELEQLVDRLRHQVEARVRPSGAALKSAPFHTATTIQTVPGNSEVAIVILTPYWYGVQTTDGHTGWIQRTQLEALP